MKERAAAMMRSLFSWFTAAKASSSEARLRALPSTNAIVQCYSATMSISAPYMETLRAKIS